MARFVLTGATGFIGKALVKVLATTGSDVIIASRTKVSHSQFEHIEFDLRDRTTFSNLVGAGADGIFHLAWSSTPALAELDPAGDLDTNVVGTVGLMENLAKLSKTRLVFVSSGGTVYGNALVLPTPETASINPIGAYGMGKATAEAYALYFWRNGMDVRIARLSNPYGPGQSTARQQGVVSVFARHIINDQPITIWGDGQVVRDYIRVEDAAAALIAIMNADLRAADFQPIFNVGTGEGSTLNELATIIATKCGKPAQLAYASARPFDLRASVLDTSRLHAVTGWRSKVDLVTGIDAVIEYIKEA